MDIKTLMIGDWVYNKYHGKNIRLTQYDFFTHTHNEFGEQELVPCARPTFGRDLEPIHLTPKILEKNGFKEYDGLYRLDIAEDVFVNAIFTSEEPFVSVYNTCYMARPICRYLHQLQHALRLCGISKEIEL